MQYLQNTPSNHLALNEVILRLGKSKAVDGLALFGSHIRASANPVSDYDLLILVIDPPTHIFQMLTYIDRRMADVVFVEAVTADSILEQKHPVAMTSFEGMFLQKMLTAQIVYDPSDRLKRVQLYAQIQQQENRLLVHSTESELYSTWFWLNQGLLHLKRMIHSNDPVYLTTVDLMLMGQLGGICRDYSRVRNLAWQGEKACVRYLQEHDPAYLELLRACIAEPDRQRTLTLYEQLVARTLEPIGTLWRAGLTAVYLRDTEQRADQLDIALHFWQELLEPR